MYRRARQNAVCVPPGVAVQNASLEVHIGSVDGQQHHGASVFPMIVRSLTANATLDQAVHWAREHSHELVRQAAQHPPRA